MTRSVRSSRLPPSCSGLACAQASPRPNSPPGWAPANPRSPDLKMVTRFRAPRHCCATPRQPAAGFTCGYRRPDASFSRLPITKSDAAWPHPQFKASNLLALVDIDVIAMRDAGVKLARAADLLMRILDHLAPLADPADGAGDREQHGKHRGGEAHRL